jgi:hypothetical protein
MRYKWPWILLTVVASALLWSIYVRTHPLVFMETHQHCIKAAGLQMLQYAGEHDGRFPYHPKSYGNALLLLNEDSYNTLTGPGYDPAVLHQAKQAGTDLGEEDCGRVYVQGLTTKCNIEIALLFDKLPTPGGDHCHFPVRMWASLGREVVFRHGGMRFVRESEWPQFVNEQVELLVAEGFAREEAERLYASKPKGQ